MASVGIVVATALVLAALFVLGRYLLLAYARYRDSKIISCPETGHAVIGSRPALARSNSKKEG